MELKASVNIGARVGVFLERVASWKQVSALGLAQSNGLWVDKGGGCFGRAAPVGNCWESSMKSGRLAAAIEEPTKWWSL